MSLDLLYDGDLSGLTLSPGSPLWMQKAGDVYANRRVDYSGEKGTLRFDPSDWGNAFTVHLGDPRPGSGSGASVRTENRLALEAERTAQERARLRSLGLSERPLSASVSPRQYTRFRPR